MGLCQFYLHSIYHVIVITIASNDNSDPVITGCPDDISVAIPSGSTRVAITWTEPTATDNSGTVISESTRSPGDTFDVGTTVITYTFTDGSGNFAICSFSVTVAGMFYFCLHYWSAFHTIVFIYMLQTKSLFMIAFS